VKQTLPLIRILLLEITSLFEGSEIYGQEVMNSAGEASTKQESERRSKKQKASWCKHQVVLAVQGWSLHNCCYLCQFGIPTQLYRLVLHRVCS